jgi:hypothetical protein
VGEAGDDVSYDFTDPKIRDMVDRHDPTEFFTHSGGRGEKVSTGIVCDTCGRTWPCWATQQLRTWREEQAKANVEALKRGST